MFLFFLFPLHDFAPKAGCHSLTTRDADQTLCFFLGYHRDFGLFSDVLVYFGMFWDVLGYFGLSTDILGYLGHFGVLWVIFGYSGVF